MKLPEVLLRNPFHCVVLNAAVSLAVNGLPYVYTCAVIYKNDHLCTSVYHLHFNCFKNINLFTLHNNSN